MVCIAVYRLCALRYPLWISAVGHSRIPRMLVMAWGIAAISMSPQLYVWKLVKTNWRRIDLLCSGRTTKRHPVPILVGREANI